MKLKDFIDLYAGEETLLCLLSDDGNEYDEYIIDETIASTRKIDKMWLNGYVNYFYFDDALRVNVSI